MSNTYKDQSRINWEPQGGREASLEELKIGAIQRIADATELMAKNYQQLIDERDRYKGYYERAREQRDKAYRRISALQGVITRMKRRKS